MGRQRRWATPARRGAISQVTSRPAAPQHLRDLARLRRGDLSVTEVCFAVGCSSLGTFSSRFTELVGVPPSVYRRQAARATAGMPSCVAKQVTRPIRNREARSPSRT
jgi:hypothetical protein